MVSYGAGRAFQNQFTDAESAGVCGVVPDIQCSRIFHAYLVNLLFGGVFCGVVYQNGVGVGSYVEGAYFHGGRGLECATLDIQVFGNDGSARRIPGQALSNVYGAFGGIDILSQGAAEAQGQVALHRGLAHVGRCGGEGGRSAGFHKEVAADIQCAVEGVACAAHGHGAGVGRAGDIHVLIAGGVVKDDGIQQVEHGAVLAFVRPVAAGAIPIRTLLTRPYQRTVDVVQRQGQGGTGLYQVVGHAVGGQVR